MLLTPCDKCGKDMTAYGSYEIRRKHPDPRRDLVKNFCSESCMYDALDRRGTRLTGPMLERLTRAS